MCFVQPDYFYPNMDNPYPSWPKNISSVSRYCTSMLNIPQWAMKSWNVFHDVRHPVYGISAKAGSHTTQTVFINERLPGHFINGSKKSSWPVHHNHRWFAHHSNPKREVPSVRCHNDISVSSHDLHIPAVWPELAYSILWATGTVKYSRIFFIGSKSGGIYNPCQHIFSHLLSSSNVLQPGPYPVDRKLCLFS